MKNKKLKQGVSVVMMGRDDADYLSKSLPPLQKMADEVIYIDTGSQDQSVLIAKQWGCRIFEQTWQDDFSKPKNFGIEQALFSWILNVDCDEVLQNEDRVKQTILQMDQNPSVPGCIIPIDNLLSDKTIATSQALRLFRNDERIRFNNPVHEGVADSLFRHWPNAPPPSIEIRLLHYGYQAGANKKKLLRNIAILRKWVDREPENIYGCYKLGMNLDHVGMSREGIYFLERAFTLWSVVENKGSYPFWETLITSYIKGLASHGMVEKVQEVQNLIRSWG